MRFLTFLDGGNTPVLGLLKGDRVLPLVGHGLPRDLPAVIAGGDKALQAILTAAEALSAVALPMSQFRLLAPIPRPSKNVYCVGRNYVEHVDEGDRASGVKDGAPPVPIFFSKPCTSVVGSEANVILHPQTTKLDYEVELGVIIGKTGTNIPEDRALDHVWGYTVINDITARDLQDLHKQWFKGKSMDTFCPIGPVAVHRDEIPDPHVLDIELRVNGKVRQRANTRQMIFNINRIVAELSAGLTLEPGDLIATGTCSGCAFGMNPPGWLQDGDVVEAEVQGIGILRNRIRAPQ